MSDGDIRTKQTRTLRAVYGPVQIECTFVDKRADPDTWIKNCGIIAAETGIPAVEIHRILFTQFPELFN